MTSKSSAFTAKNYQLAKAPKRIQLLGDKTKRPEPAQHIIEFPGGAIELSRTSEGHYWAHIIVNRRGSVPDCDGLKSATATVVDGRVDMADGVMPLPVELREVDQVALLIRVDAHDGGCTCAKCRAAIQAAAKESGF